MFLPRFYNVFLVLFVPSDPNLGFKNQKFTSLQSRSTAAQEPLSDVSFHGFKETTGPVIGLVTNPCGTGVKCLNWVTSFSQEGNRSDLAAHCSLENWAPIGCVWGIEHPEKAACLMMFLCDIPSRFCWHFPKDVARNRKLGHNSGTAKSYAAVTAKHEEMMTIAQAPGILKGRINLVPLLKPGFKNVWHHVGPGFLIRV